MKKCFIAVLMAVLAFASCSQKEAYEPLNTVITASFEQDAAQTRLSVSTNNLLTWTADDAFMMFGNGSSAKFVLTSGGGSANGTFSGVVPAEVKAAAYPWESDNRPSLSGNTLTMNLPAVLDQTTIGKCNLPMYASVSSVQSISFKHLAGVMKINFSDIPVGYNSLTIKASNPISGAFTADVSQSDPVLASTSTAADDKVIIVNFTAATAEDNDKVLYIPLPVGTYDYIDVEISNGTDTKELITYNNKTVERAKVYTASLTYSDVNASTPSTEEALIAAIEKGGNVTLTSDITVSKPIEVTKDVTIDLNGMTLTAGVWEEDGENNSYVFWVKGGTLTINGDDNSKIAAQSATYSMAVWANGGNVVINGGKYVNSGDGCDLIYLKGQSTVTINGGTFVATQKFGVEPGTNNARSAINVSDADYKSGNSKVFVQGGKFFEFNPADNVSEGKNTNFVVPGYSSVAEGNYYVVSEGIKNEAALHAAVAAGGNVKLSSNIDLASSIFVTNDVTVDLNGHNLICNSSDVFVVTAGTLTLNGTGVVWGSSDNSSSSCAVWAKENGKVIINGGTYKVGHDGASKNNNSTNWRNDCIYVRGNASVTINGGEFMYTGEVDPNNYESNGHAFLLNQLDDDRNTSSITVTGGKFYKFNPADNTAEGANTNFLAEGYKSVQDGDVYTVVADNQ